MKDLKIFLDKEYNIRNRVDELSEVKADPLLIAREQNNDLAILTCALFAYGNAKQIVKFLQKFPFDILDRPVSEKHIRSRVNDLKYRLQSTEDIVQWILILQKIRQKEKELQKEANNSLPKQSILKNLFLEEYSESKNVIKSIYIMIEALYITTDYNSKGLTFLIGNRQPNKSPLKRWNMFLRWMVRNDNLDLGYWDDVDTADLIIPLDTLSFNLGKKLGLINIKTYNLNAAIELTNNLKKFNKDDPVKYDFVLYRLGQEKMIIDLSKTIN